MRRSHARFSCITGFRDKARQKVGSVQLGDHSTPNSADAIHRTLTRRPNRRGDSTLPRNTSTRIEQYAFIPTAVLTDAPSLIYFAM